MIGKILAVMSLLSASSVFAGGGFGGNPPALQDADELLSISNERFQTLALDALHKPDAIVLLNGKPANPLMIDIQSKILRFESLETKKIIDVSAEVPQP